MPECEGSVAYCPLSGQHIIDPSVLIVLSCLEFITPMRSCHTKGDSPTLPKRRHIHPIDPPHSAASKLRHRCMTTTIFMSPFNPCTQRVATQGSCCPPPSNKWAMYVLHDLAFGPWLIMIHYQRQQQVSLNIAAPPNQYPAYDEVSGPNHSTLSASSNQRFENTKKIPSFVQAPVLTPPNLNSTLPPATPLYTESGNRGISTAELFSPLLGPSSDNWMGRGRGALDSNPSATKGGNKSRSSLSTPKPKLEKNRRRIPCPRSGCEKMFGRPYDAKRHMTMSCKDQSNFRRIPCPHCHKKYSRQDSLDRHLANVAVAAVANTPPLR